MRGLGDWLVLYRKDMQVIGDWCTHRLLAAPALQGFCTSWCSDLLLSPCNTALTQPCTLCAALALAVALSSCYLHACM